MQEKKYNDTKKEIRSVLLTYQSSIPLVEFIKSYKTLTGERLPSRALGFTSDVEFLQSMPDAVNVCTDPTGKVLLSGIADETSEHIQKLVSKQRKSQSKGSKSNKNCPRQRFQNSSPVIKEQVFLSGTLRAEIMKVMNMYRDGVTFTNFAIAYRRKFNRYLPLVKGLDSIEDMINLIPELQIRCINNEKTICFTNNDIHNSHLKTSVTMKNVSSPQGKGDNREKKLPTDSIPLDIHKSGITKEMLQNFELLLKKCPEGIADVYFPPLYENLTKESFDLHELGYTSVLELVDALPHVFKRILNPEGGKNWIILPAESPKKDYSYGKSIKRFQLGIPSDAASPSLQFSNPVMPQNLDVTKHVPVYISAIINPSLFWFQLQIESTIKEFQKFETDMGYFYDHHAGSMYVMQDSDIVIGATCVALNPEDKRWYRAIIQSLPTVKSVNVSFVDYGSRETVPRLNLYYVRNKYHEYPAYAFKAQLAGLKPTQNATTWNIKAQQRFIQLCKCTLLMAYLKPINEDTFSAYLCDTSGESDVHFEDTLLDEGLAELSLENQFNCNGNGHQKDSKEPAFDRISSDTENYFSSASSEHIQSTTPKKPFSPKKFNTKQLTFSPVVLTDRVESNTLLNNPVKKSKRFVKKVHLCEDCEIHVINLESRLFMACGELSKLLWSEKDSSYLIERMKYKEVCCPSLNLSKEEYVSLFEQCIYYKIPEYEKLKPSNSSLILYPLKSAFEILNVFGHPSVCLRLVINNEISSFNPSDPIWKEFEYEELTLNLSDLEKDIEEQLKNLCLYDLKAKNEALKIKRIKLLQEQNVSSNEDIQTIDNILRVIKRSMKKIESICSQYSSCS